MPGLAVVASLALVGVACSEGDSAESTEKMSAESAGEALFASEDFEGFVPGDA